MQRETASFSSFVAVFALFTSAGRAADLAVPAQFPTIGSALAAAASGDRILIDPGVYAETLLIEGKSIELIGLAGAAKTVLDGRGLSGSIVRIENQGGGGGLQVRLEGLTIRNGTGFGAAGETRGGGVHALGGTLLVDGCHFVQNGVTRRGGAASLDAGVVSEWRNCVFFANSASAATGSSIGGAVHLWFFAGEASFIDCSFVDNVAVGGSGFGSGGAVFAATPATFEGCEFIGNRAPMSAGPSIQGGGGAIAASGAVEISVASCLFEGQEGNALQGFASSWTVTESQFSGNATQGYGGAIQTVGGEVSVSDSVFTANSAVQQGGAIDANGSSVLSLVDCLFEANTANYGAAVTKAGMTATITRTSFIGNQAASVGGACLPFAGAAMTLIDCEVVGNDGGFAGGGFWVAQGSSLTLSGTTVCDNLPDQIDGIWADGGGNAVCAGPEVGDLDGNGVVDAADLAILLGEWGTFGPRGNLDNDLTVDAADLSILLGAWTR